MNRKRAITKKIREHTISVPQNVQTMANGVYTHLTQQCMVQQWQVVPRNGMRFEDPSILDSCFGWDLGFLQPTHPVFFHFLRHVAAQVRVSVALRCQAKCSIMRYKIWHRMHL